MKQKLSPYRNINAFIRKGERYYVAECVEIGVVTQGKTVDETIANLREAVALHLENEDLAELGLAPNPSLIITMELEPILSDV
ncbi:MAG: type II toxin-antitoxin system HicB family antitoxin [candidate division WOR-3 bacterium]